MNGFPRRKVSLPPKELRKGKYAYSSKNYSDSIAHKPLILKAILVATDAGIAEGRNLAAT